MKPTPREAKLIHEKYDRVVKHLIDETEKRRKIQIDYNNKNNITPKTILKNLDEIKSSTIVADKEIGEIIELEQKMELDDLDTLELKDKVKEIERKMLNYAKELQFEKAALLRNQLEKIKKNIPGDGDV